MSSAMRRDTTLGCGVRYSGLCPTDSPPRGRETAEYSFVEKRASEPRRRAIPSLRSKSATASGRIAMARGRNLVRAELLRHSVDAKGARPQGAEASGCHAETCDTRIDSRETPTEPGQ